MIMLRVLSSRAFLWVSAFLALVFSWLFFNAFPGDPLMYHLPFAARFWHLSG
jgi:hypothetical protein